MNEGRGEGEHAVTGKFSPLLFLFAAAVVVLPLPPPQRHYRRVLVVCRVPNCDGCCGVVARVSLHPVLLLLLVFWGAASSVQPCDWC
ncbi:hypothetical protein BVRB_9g205090 [Beta vulgaris subsp. vulgaris]|nr:hypothetical protein BVRB_9g205090 [Beta vulgaris subsp. vulgaris]